MGGKGQRRREKNYRAAHGGDTTLPPPPKLRELEAIPTKLRRLMAFTKNTTNSTNPQSGESSRKDGDVGRKRKREKDSGENDKKVNQKNLESPADLISHGKTKEDNVADPGVDGDSTKGKRKRKKVMDLRFLELDQAASKTRKKKRKEYLQAKKKKNKNDKTDGIPDFPGREKINFGEVVEAPPKLTFPKVKSPMNASRERIRLQAIEDYRNHRGWTNRPGLKLPAQLETPCLY